MFTGTEKQDQLPTFINITTLNSYKASLLETGVYDQFELFWNALSNMFDHHSFTDRGKFVDYTVTVDRDNVSYGTELIEKI